MEHLDEHEVAVLSVDETAGSLTVNSEGHGINETNTNRYTSMLHGSVLKGAKNFVYLINI